MTSITITEETDDTISFDVEDLPVEVANALRRTMMGDITTLAIEEVTITANNTGLFDEMLAHRLGTIPWTFPVGELVPRDDCDCEDGCTDCQVSMALQATGPATVTADDITIPAEGVEAANPDTVIARLQEGDSLDLEMTAILGRGKDHAKWQAANAAYSRDGDTTQFTVESVSGLDPETIVAMAVERFRDRLDTFETAIEGDL